MQTFVVKNRIFHNLRPPRYESRKQISSIKLFFLVCLLDLEVNRSADLVIVVRNRSLDSLLGKHGAVKLVRRQTVKRFDNSFVCKL